IEEWHAVAEGEALWVAECDVQTIARHTSEPFSDDSGEAEDESEEQMRAIVKPYPPPRDIASAGDQVGDSDDGPYGA
ncbi:MAG: hypothetical protein RIT24_204, partial [Planctomycetota bacterium]